VQGVVPWTLPETRPVMKRSIALAYGGKMAICCGVRPTRPAFAGQPTCGSTGNLAERALYRFAR